MTTVADTTNKVAFRAVSPECASGTSSRYDVLGQSLPLCRFVNPELRYQTMILIYLSSAVNTRQRLILTMALNIFAPYNPGLV